MIVFYNNPIDKDSVEALQALFVSGHRLPVICPGVAKGRLVIVSEDMQTEYASIDDPKQVNKAALGWMKNADANGPRKGKPLDMTGAPAAVKAKGQGSGKGNGGGHA
jgi:hypothetical protein